MGATRGAGRVRKLWWALLVAWSILFVGFFVFERTVEARLARKGDRVRVEGETAFGLDGATHVVQPPDSAVVLLFVSSGCAACRRYLPTYPVWQSYARNTGAAFRVLLVEESRPTNHNFVRALPDSALVLVERSPKLRRKLRVRVVPLMMRVERGGVVTKVVTLGPQWPKLNGAAAP